MFDDGNGLGVGIEIVRAGDRLRLVGLWVEHLDGPVVLDGDQRRLLGVVDVAQSVGVGSVAVLVAGLVPVTRAQPGALEISPGAGDEHGPVVVHGIDHVTLAVRRESDGEGDPVDLFAVLVLGDERRVFLDGTAEPSHDPLGDPSPEFVRRKLQIEPVVGPGNLGHERVPVPLSLALGEMLACDLFCLAKFLVAGLSVRRAYLDDGGVVIAGDSTAAIAGARAELHGHCDRRLDRRLADDAGEKAVHPDRRPIDLLGLDAPADPLGIDVDAQGLAYLLDRDVGVVSRVDVHPTVPAFDRTTLTAVVHLDALGRVDEFEALEVTRVTQRRLPTSHADVVWHRYGIATLRTEGARIAHYGVVNTYGATSEKERESVSRPRRDRETDRRGALMRIDPRSSRMEWSTDWGLRARMVLTFVLLAALYVFFAAALLYMGTGTALVVLFFATLPLIQYFFSDTLALRGMGARTVTEEEEPELHRMVSRLSQQADIPKPTVAIANTQTPNAFATGRNQRKATVCVTTGLVETLDQEELEGVIAHELAHVKHRDMMVMTIASFLSTVAFLIVRFGIYFVGGRRNNGGFLVAIVVSLVVWIVSYFLTRALSRYREYSADRGAAQITGSPGALASALLTISGKMDRMPEQDLRDQEEMNAFFIIPISKGLISKLFSTHPPTEKRVERLQQMEQELAGV